MSVDTIEYKIYGDDMQIVEIVLDPGEGVQAEVGTMLYMEDNIEMQTTTGGGIFKGIKRVFTGESFFITTFLNKGTDLRRIAFAAPYPGKIIPLDLGELGGSFYCQKDSFLCAANGTEIKVAFTKKIGTGLFGGEGFILQELQGDGWVFIHAGGTILERDLAEGETLKVDTGCLAAFASTVTYDIRFVRGIKNALFGGEGLFLANIKGPGKVFLQSLPFSRLADRVNKASGIMGSSKGESRRFGGILGDIIRGD